MGKYPQILRQILVFIGINLGSHVITCCITVTYLAGDIELFASIIYGFQ